MALAVRAERREEGLTKASRTWVRNMECDSRCAFYCSGWDDRAVKNLSGVACSGSKRGGRGGAERRRKTLSDLSATG